MHMCATNSTLLPARSEVKRQIKYKYLNIKFSYPIKKQEMLYLLERVLQMPQTLTYDY